MSLPDITTLYDVCDATWPAAARHDHEGWILREGAGGGQRVSAATTKTPGALPDIAAAETGMRALNQPPLFMVRGGEHALDQALEARGYAIKDPVTFWVGQASEMAETDAPRMSAFTAWPPAAIMCELWAQGGISATRIDVMRRASLPKVAIFSRSNDRPSGVAYVGIHKNCAMLHALEVNPAHRRQGVGHNIMRKAAFWAQHNGAKWISVIVTCENSGANALYASLNMHSVGHYHYRTMTG